MLIRTRQAKTLFDAAKGLKGIASSDTIERLAEAAAEVLTGKPMVPTLSSAEKKLKLRGYIDYRLDEVEPLSKELIENLLKDHMSEYEAGRMLPEVYRAFSLELQRRLKMLN